MNADFVIDANIAVRFFVNIEHSEFIETLFYKKRPFAPDLIISETSSALRKYVLSGDMSVEAAMVSINMLPNMIDQSPTGSMGADAIKLSIDLNHPVYDCYYAVCAKMMSLPFLTADKKFVRKIESSNFKVEIIELSQLAKNYEN